MPVVPLGCRTQSRGLSSAPAFCSPCSCDRVPGAPASTPAEVGAPGTPSSCATRSTANWPNRILWILSGRNSGAFTRRVHPARSPGAFARGDASCAVVGPRPSRRAATIRASPMAAPERADGGGTEQMGSERNSTTALVARWIRSRLQKRGPAGGVGSRGPREHGTILKVPSPPENAKVPSPPESSLRSRRTRSGAGGRAQEPGDALRRTSATTGPGSHRRGSYEKAKKAQKAMGEGGSKRPRCHKRKPPESGTCTKKYKGVRRNQKTTGKGNSKPSGRVRKPPARRNRAVRQDRTP